ncbi:MAG: MIP family channel protein, partial [Sedimentisphaerales bacterium]|nr:MIP family channel protein [Sedimentisphaerales bacterium]
DTPCLKTFDQSSFKELHSMNKKALIAEFIGTFALIFIGVGAIAADFATNGKSGLTGIALAHGLTIAVMVSATAAISGGHLNPAVTLGLFAAKKIDLKNSIGYIIAQCAGAVAAAFTAGLCIPHDTLRAVAMGIPARGVGVSEGAAVLTELVLTFFLVFVVLGTAVDKRAPKVGGLFIGLTVTLDILMGGPITGGAMNPARHLGPAVVGGWFKDTWIYWVGPMAGGVLAGLVYKNFLEDK